METIGSIEEAIGSIEEVRTVKEYTCLSSTIDIGLLLDETDVLGQAGLKAAFASNVEVVIAIELSDSLGLNGEGVTIDFTVEIASEVVTIPAA